MAWGTGEGIHDAEKSAKQPKSTGAEAPALHPAELTVLLRQENDHENDKDVPGNVQEAEYRRRWFPWLVITVAVNVLLYISMIYATVKIKEYQSQRSHYLASAWLILAIPFVVILYLLLSPFPDSLRSWRNDVGRRKPSPNYLPVVNIINGLACFLFVVLYLYGNAIPEYNTATWQTAVNYVDIFPIPAIAVIFSRYAVPTANDPEVLLSNSSTGTIPVCFVTQAASGNEGRFPFSSITSMEIGDGVAYVFNPSGVTSNQTAVTSLQDTIEFDFFINCTSTRSNSVISQRLTEILDNSSTSSVPITQLNMGVVFFDPRMSFEDLFNCGFVGIKIVPAFAFNTFSLIIEQITDSCSLMNQPASLSATCKQAYQNLLSNADQPYTTYSFNAGPPIPQVSNVSQECDLAVNPSNTCLSAVHFNFDSHIVTSTSSVPGLRKLDIWLNAGAVVGAVQFFAWFLGVFAA